MPPDVFTAQGVRTSRRPNHTVPYGTELVSRGYQALRTWLLSFSPFGTTKHQYLVKGLERAMSIRWNEA
jgi:hypothetical protein